MIKKVGGEASFLRADVSNARHVARVISYALKKHGRIDILVNNAGIYTKGPIEELSEQDWDRVIAVNLKGPFLLSKAVSGQFIERRRGVILNIISISAEIPQINTGAYTTSKAGLLGLTKSLAAEWAKYGIRVVGISPGPIATPMHEREYRDQQYRNARYSAVPIGRPGTSEEVAQLAEFLVSDEAGFITGQTVLIDGGSAISMFHTIGLLKEFATKTQVR
jgi:NAD(P)-dependent dehydrogenase (short-subunit alcohol dehydrogenase family)